MIKKPKKLTPDEFEAVLAKRKKKTISVEKRIPGGTMPKVIEVAEKFAEENGVTLDDVRIPNGYYSNWFSVKRLETDEEFRKRVKDEEDYKYQQKKYEYDREQERIAYELQVQAASQARIAAMTNTTTNCCSATCCCRKNEGC
jgi:hypothetical protein